METRKYLERLAELAKELHNDAKSAKTEKDVETSIVKLLNSLKTNDTNLDLGSIRFEEIPDFPQWPETTNPFRQFAIPPGLIPTADESNEETKNKLNKLHSYVKTMKKLR